MKTPLMITLALFTLLLTACQETQNFGAHNQDEVIYRLTNDADSQDKPLEPDFEKYYLDFKIAKKFLAGRRPSLYSRHINRFNLKFTYPDLLSVTEFKHLHGRKPDNSESIYLEISLGIYRDCFMDGCTARLQQFVDSRNISSLKDFRRMIKVSESYEGKLIHYTPPKEVPYRGELYLIKDDLLPFPSYAECILLKNPAVDHCNIATNINPIVSADYRIGAQYIQQLPEVDRMVRNFIHTLIINEYNGYEK